MFDAQSEHSSEVSPRIRSEAQKIIELLKQEPFYEDWTIQQLIDFAVAECQRQEDLKVKRLEKKYKGKNFGKMFEGGVILCDIIKVFGEVK